MNEYGISRRRFLQVGGAGTLVPVVGTLLLSRCTPEQANVVFTQLAELPNLINAYRAQKGLSAIPISDHLTTVALKHIIDLNGHHPENACCPPGGNPHRWVHSWSNNGNWQGTFGIGDFKGCCYDPDSTAEPNKRCMWDKPKETTNYPSEGFEIGDWAGGPITAQMALNDWKNSQPHNDVILSAGAWAKFQWQALGAYAGGTYACAWFGTVKS